MKKSIYVALATLGLLASSAVNAAGPSNSIRGGILANSVGNVKVFEYEKMFRDRISIGARVGMLEYEYDESDYDEDGDGNGAEVLFRIYPSGDGFKGFYFGVAAGFWQTSWDFIEREGLATYIGSGDTDSINVNVGVGWKIPLGSNKMYLDPSIQVGNYFGISNSSSYCAYNQFGSLLYCEDDPESELGIYVAGGIAFGVNF